MNNTEIKVFLETTRKDSRLYTGVGHTYIPRKGDHVMVNMCLYEVRDVIHCIQDNEVKVMVLPPK